KSAPPRPNPVPPRCCWALSPWPARCCAAMQRAAKTAAGLLPDIASFAALAAVLFAILLRAEVRFFADSDPGWHIQTGYCIWRHGATPRADPFPFAAGNRIWYAWEGASDLLMAALHRLGGLPAVTAFYIASGALAVWLW